MVNRTALLFLLSLASLLVRADDVYRWLDENGNPQYGHVVPEKYKQKARKVDTAGSAVTDEQREEALRRSANERARLDALQQSREKKAAAAPPLKPSPPAVAKTETCEEQLRKYTASMACFEKYRTATGRIVGGGTGFGVRPEAFKECQEVPQPQGCLQAPDSSDRTYLPPAPASR